MRYLNSILVTGGVVLMPASYAYADTLTQMVETVKSSTTYTFGVGAAAGAIVAGLLGFALHARSKRRYKRQIRHLEQKVEDSQHIASIAQSRLINLQEEYAAYRDSGQEETGEGVVANADEAEPEDVAQTLEADEVLANESEVAEDAQMAEVVEDAVKESSPTDGSANSDDAVVSNADASSEEETTSTQTLLDDEDEGANEEVHEEAAEEASEEASERVEEAVEPEAGETDQAVEDEQPVSFATRRTVRMVLDERLAPDALGEGFGKFATRLAHTSETPAFLGHRRARQYDPVIRASLIDQRVPRFDESLFPDVVSHVHDEVDMFETAMRAMEDTLQHTAVLGIEEQESVLYALPENERPEIIDAAAYVDFILQDEIEKTKSGEPLSTTNPHLRMFEGTGDLNASKKVGTHQPDHMRTVSDED